MDGTAPSPPGSPGAPDDRASPAIECRDVAKLFRVYPSGVHRAVEALTLGRFPFHREIWALDGVSLSVGRGSALGVIGSNGAGKSTLLKILTRTTFPTRGSVRVAGKVAGLLDLGTGFHPDFSGRDNVFMNAALLGFSREEIGERFEAIAEFSELGDVIDRPVRTYSSGMAMRLGFSVASALDPDVLVIDEVLAVGDQHFQKKCVDRIYGLRYAGKTILICTHVMHYVRQICDRAIWLNAGRVEREGHPIEITNDYLCFERTRSAERPPGSAALAPRRAEAPSGERPRIKHVSVTGAGSGEPIRVIRTGDDIEICVEYEAPNGTSEFAVSAVVARVDGLDCFGGRSGPFTRRAESRSGRAVFRVRRVRLLAGEFEARVALVDARTGETLDEATGGPRFKVAYSGYEPALYLADGSWGFREPGGGT